VNLRNNTMSYYYSVIFFDKDKSYDIHTGTSTHEYVFIQNRDYSAG